MLAIKLIPDFIGQTQMNATQSHSNVLKQACLDKIYLKIDYLVKVYYRTLLSWLTRH